MLGRPSCDLYLENPLFFSYSHPPPHPAIQPQSSPNPLPVYGHAEMLIQVCSLQYKVVITYSFNFQFHDLTIKKHTQHMYDIGALKEGAVFQHTLLSKFMQSLHQLKMYSYDKNLNEAVQTRMKVKFLKNFLKVMNQITCKCYIFHEEDISQNSSNLLN